MLNPRWVVGSLLCIGIAVGWAASCLAQDELVDLVVGLLNDPDKETRAIAYEQIRTEVPGEAATRKFADLLPELPVESQVGLLSALADRGDHAAAPAVRQLIAETDNDETRIAAIKALGKLGGPYDLPTLNKLLSTGSPEEQEAARRSLVVLSGEEISSAIAAKMNDSPAELRVALIEILTTRRARDAADAILKAAVDDDPVVRRAAMAALGSIAEPKHISGMVQGVLAAERGRERDAAEKAIMLVCHRSEDQQQRADPLREAMRNLSEGDRTILLSALARVGGPDARKDIEAAINDPKTHEAGLRALCNWSDASVAFRLLELARTEENAGDRRMALRALIRVAPLPDDRPDSLRLDLMRTAMAMSWEDDDRLLVLERAKAVRTVETLRYIVRYIDEPKFAEPACLTIVELAHHSGLRESHRDEFHAALDRVIETSKDATVVDRAQRYNKGQTWVRPK